MANKPYEQDVILDADGKPVFAALEQIRKQIDQIQRAVAQTARLANKGVADYGNILTKQTKEMQQSMAQMRTLAQAKNNPGLPIQDALANQKLGKATIQATEYARGLTAAGTAADALRGKLNLLNAEVAKRGALGRGETIRQTAMRRSFEEQLALIKRLDAEMTRLERRTSRTQLSGINTTGLSTRRDALLNARAAVNTAALDPTRNSIQREINAYQKELDRYDVFLASLKTKHAQRLADQRAADRQLESQQKEANRKREAEQKTADAKALQDAKNFNRAKAQASLDDGKARMREAASEIQGLTALNAARARAIEQLRAMRSARGGVQGSAQLTELSRKIALEREFIAALEREIRVQERLQMEAKRRLEQGNRPSMLQRELTPSYLAGAAGRVGIYATASAAIYGLFNVIQGGLSYVIQLEDELAKLSAIADATEGQMQRLTAAIQDVASGSRFSTIELVQISQKLAQAGVSALQMRDALQAVTTLATASGSSPDETVNLITAALGSFQLQASEAARVADLMTTALNRTRLTVEQAGAAIQYVGATAYEQNITLEELLATAATMSQAGIKSGSTIGTGLRQFLVDLASPSEKLTEQFELLGLTAEDLDVSVRGLPAVLQTMNEAGFGAAQAYEGLETRAAAAYLVMKNNTDVMDDLRLSMLETGAAAEANARGMDSITARWQEFKNVVGEWFSTVMEQDVEDLKTLLGALTEIVDELNAFNTIEKYGGGLEGARALFTMDHEEVLAYAEELRAANATGRDLETVLSDLSSSIETQRGSISELTHEYQRLLVQKDALISNEVRAQAETESLMQRFAGLGQYLTNTENSYVNLTAAVRRFIAASEEALQADLILQRAQLGNQGEELRRARGSTYTQIRQSQAFNTLPENVRAAIEVPRTRGPGTDEFVRAMHIIDGYVSANSTGPLATLLRDYTANLSQGQGNWRALSMNRRATNNSEAITRNPNIAAANERAQQIEAMLTRARHSDTQARDVERIYSQIDTAEQELRAAQVNPRYVDAKNSILSDLYSLRQQARALVTPTESDRTAAATAQRQADREAQRPLVTRQPVIDTVMGMGFEGMRVGSGYRSQAEQDSLRARGATNARVSDHTTGIGQDFPIPLMSQAEGDRIAAAIQTRLDEQGVTARVIYERGGPGQGTGSHIHVGIAQGTRYKQGTGPDGNGNPADGQQYQARLARARQRLDTAELARRIEEAQVAASRETYSAAVAAAEEARARVEADIREMAAAELAAEGLGPDDPEYQARLSQVEEEVRQLNEDMRKKLADAILANVRTAFEAADRYLNDMTAGAEQTVRMAEARVNGFGYASMDNRVPDYVRVLAERQSAQARESADRARLEALPGAIEMKQASLSDAQARLSMLNSTTVEYEEQAAAIAQLREEIRAMTEEQLVLQASLGASAEIPTTLGEGMEKAIEAFQLTHRMAGSLQEEIIYNMGGALDMASQSVNTFFTDILTGSRNALSAFGNMAMGILRYVQQMIAQMVAQQLFGKLLSLAGMAMGNAGGGFSTSGSSPPWAINNFAHAYTGGKAGFGMDSIQGYLGGGKVANGFRTHDSVLAKLAKDEWIVNRSAAESVGDEFMSDLNRRGRKAIMDRVEPAAVFPQAEQTTNVYVVAPDQKPTLGKNDVVVVLHDELVNGQSRKLVKSISQGA